MKEEHIELLRAKRLELLENTVVDSGFLDHLVSDFILPSEMHEMLRASFVLFPNFLS